jgi:hypothetical protein
MFISIIKYMINKIKILELKKEIDTIYNLATKNLNDIIILKLKFYDYYYSEIIDENTKQFIGLHINTSYILNDFKYKKFKKDLEDYKKLACIDSALKSYLISDLIGVTKYYFSNVTHKTCIKRKSHIEIYITIPLPKEIPTDKELIFNSNIIPEFFVDDKYGFVFKSKDDVYFRICKYESGNIKMLSFDDKCIINYFRLCILNDLDYYILEIEEYLNNKKSEK